MNWKNKIMFIMLLALLFLTGCSIDKEKLEEKALDKVEEVLTDALDKASDGIGKALDKAVGIDEGELPRLKEGIIPEAYILAEEDRVAGVIRDGFIAKDADLITELFCEYAHEHYDLDAQTKDAFEFVDGNIVSVGEIKSGGGSESTSTEHGSEEIQYLVGFEAITDTGKSYKINIEAHYNYRLHEDMVGVNLISVIDDAVPRDKAGNYVPEGRIWIGND